MKRFVIRYGDDDFTEVRHRGSIESTLRKIRNQLENLPDNEGVEIEVMRDDNSPLPDSDIEMLTLRTTP